METQNGRRTREALQHQLGEKKGTRAYYDSINSGKLRDTHSKTGDWESKQAVAAKRAGPGIRKTFKLKEKHRKHIAEGLREYHSKRGRRGYNPAAHSI